MKTIDADRLRDYFATIPPDSYTTAYILAVIDELAEEAPEDQEASTSPKLYVDDLKEGRRVYTFENTPAEDMEVEE